MKYTEAFFSLCTGFFTGVFLNEYKSKRKIEEIESRKESFITSKMEELRKKVVLQELLRKVKSSNYVFFLYVDSIIPFYDNATISVSLKEFLMYKYENQFKFHEEDLEKLTPLMDMASKRLQPTAPPFVLTTPLRDFVEKTDADFPIYEFIVKFLIKYFGIYFVLNGEFPPKIEYYLYKQRCTESILKGDCTAKMFTRVCAFLVTLGCFNIVTPMVQLVQSELNKEFAGEMDNLNYILNSESDIYSNKPKNPRSSQSSDTIQRDIETNNNFSTQLLECQQKFSSGENQYIPKREQGYYIQCESKTLRLGQSSEIFGTPRNQSFRSSSQADVETISSLSGGGSSSIRENGPKKDSSLHKPNSPSVLGMFGELF
jgi:hypothetical protein